MTTALPTKIPATLHADPFTVLAANPKQVVFGCQRVKDVVTMSVCTSSHGIHVNPGLKQAPASWPYPPEASSACSLSARVLLQCVLESVMCLASTRQTTRQAVGLRADEWLEWQEAALSQDRCNVLVAPGWLRPRAVGGHGCAAIPRALLDRHTTIVANSRYVRLTRDDANTGDTQSRKPSAMRGARCRHE